MLVGAVQAASPLGFWWLDPATVYAFGLAVIASVDVGFAVADGHREIIAIESGVAMTFVVIGAAGITGPAWLLVPGFATHGLKDPHVPSRGDPSDGSPDRLIAGDPFVEQDLLEASWMKGWITE